MPKKLFPSIANDEVPQVLSSAAAARMFSTGIPSLSAAGCVSATCASTKRSFPFCPTPVWAATGWISEPWALIATGIPGPLLGFPVVPSVVHWPPSELPAGTRGSSGLKPALASASAIARRRNGRSAMSNTTCGMPWSHAFARSPCSSASSRRRHRETNGSPSSSSSSSRANRHNRPARGPRPRKTTAPAPRCTSTRSARNTPVSISMSRPSPSRVCPIAVSLPRRGDDRTNHELSQFRIWIGPVNGAGAFRPTGIRHPRMWSRPRPDKGRRARPLFPLLFAGINRQPASPARLRLRLGADAARAARGRHRAAPAGTGTRLVGRGTRPGRGFAHDPLALDDAADLVGRQRLVFQQAVGERMQLVEMRRQDRPRGVLALLDEAADLVVDDLGGGVGDVLALRHRMAEEHLFLIVAVAQRPELLRKAEFGDHAPGEAGGAADVVGSAGGDVLRTEDQLLGDPAAKEARQHRFDLEL